MARRSTARPANFPRGFAPFVGVIQLPPLAGAPGARTLHPSDALARAGRFALADAATLARAGFGAVLIENGGDHPYFGKSVPPETVASMAILAAAIRESTPMPIGIRVLRNDVSAALAVAAVGGCDFVRMRYERTRVADWIRDRDRLGAEIRVLVDYEILLRRPTVSPPEFASELERFCRRAGADGLVLTGRMGDDLPEAWRNVVETLGARGIPAWLDGDTTSEAPAKITGTGLGIFVGTRIRKGSRAGGPLDQGRIREWMNAGKAK